jgi:hypothetical protein
MSWEDLKKVSFFRNNSKRISRLRQQLKLLFGITSDPFSPYTKQQGWRTRFKVSDEPSAIETAQAANEMTD